MRWSEFAKSCPEGPYHCFAFDIDRVGLVRFKEDDRHVWTWRVGGELRRRVVSTHPNRQCPVRPGHQDNRVPYAETLDS